MTSIIIFLIMLVLFVVFIVFSGVILVQQSEQVVIERLGRFHRKLGSGLHVIVPGVDRRRIIKWQEYKKQEDGELHFREWETFRIDMRERVFDFPPQHVITFDNVYLQIDAALYYQVIDSSHVAYQIENAPQAIEMLAQTALRNLIGEMSLDECLSSRDKINASLQQILDEATGKWGVKINRVELQTISPPEDVIRAMEKEMRAERERRATVAMAEGERSADILEAEGKKESQIIQAEGEAVARVRVAQAEAEAIRRVTQALQESGSSPSQYLIAMRYLEALQEMVTGKENKVVYLPFEATGVLGSLGGIREMFKDLNQNSRLEQDSS